MARKKVKKQDMDEQLLQAIFAVEREWKQIKTIVEKSIEPTAAGRNAIAIAQAKYIYLLQEARRRKVSAIRYSK